MNPALPHIPALASAIQTRLAAGDDVALAGLGRLRRVHEPARVTTREDGQKILLPPKNSIQFASNREAGLVSDAALAGALSDALPKDANLSDDALDDALAELRQQLEKDGELLLADIGLFRKEIGDVSFEPAESLMAAVNKPFAGLPPITTGTGAVLEEAEAETSTVFEEVAVDVQGDVAETAFLAGENPTSTPGVTVLDLLARQTSEEPEWAASPAFAMENAAEATPSPLLTGNEGEEIVAAKDVGEDGIPVSDAAIDEDIDALLAGVWMPAGDGSNEGMIDLLDRTPEAAERPDNPTLPMSEQEHATSPSVGEGAGTAVAAASAILSSDGSLTGNRHAEHRRRNNVAFVLVPAVLVLCVLAIAALWPRFTGGDSEGLGGAESGSATASDGSSADTLFATHAGGTSDTEVGEPADPATFESLQTPLDDDKPLPEEVASPAPPRAVAAPTRPSAESSGTQADAGLPQQLRGPGEVNPAHGGSTWILASGNRTSAEELASRYRAQGYRSSVLAGEANGMTVYRVAVGQFASAVEARGLRTRLPSDAPASTWVLSF